MAVRLLHNNQAALVDFRDKVDRNFFESYPTVRVVGSNTTGIEHLDFAEAEKRGIKIITLRGETEFLKGITSTAEHTIGLMMLVSRYAYAPEPGHVLRGKSLGIIGLGRIGRQMVKLGKAFGMTVMACDKGKGDINPIPISCDFISLHIPLEGNEGYFTRDFFRQMKSSAYFINTSRDGVVEPGALRWALEHKLIAGAAVDFTDSKDLVEYAQEHDNLVLTPHLGGATIEDRKLTEEFIEKKINDYLYAER